MLIIRTQRGRPPCSFKVIPLKFLLPPNLLTFLHLSLSIGQVLGVGVHIMAANRQSLVRANIGVISGQPATSTPTSTTTDHNAVGGESRLLTPANS